MIRCVVTTSINPPIKIYENEIREKILLGLEPYRENLLNTGDFQYRIFMHIRRGDYLDNPTYHFLTDISYYKKAVNLLKPLKPIIITSNDINWVKNNEYFNDSRYFEIFDGDTVETLAMMSLCKEGAICANSTFSWWGAFLGAYSERKPVIVPRKWVRDKIEELFPEEWVILD